MSRLRTTDNDGNVNIQGHPERMSKVNPFARALIFTKSGFSGVFSVLTFDTFICLYCEEISIDNAILSSE